jgi:hypothetical protein
MRHRLAFQATLLAGFLTAGSLCQGGRAAAIQELLDAKP